MVGPSVRYVQRIAYTATILTAELCGIRLAVNHIIETKSMKSVVYTDSLSSLRALSSLNTSKHPIIIELQNKIIDASKRNIKIVFCWVPSHVGIPGNEEADLAASSAGDKEVELHDIPYKDYHRLLRHRIREKWQQEWDEEVNNKLHTVKPLLSEWESTRHRERFYEVVLCRLRIGHTHLTHGHLLRREEAPECEHCNNPLTVAHILLECPAYDLDRGKHFSQLYKEHTPLNLPILLGNEPLVPHHSVFSFLIAIGLLHRL